MTSHLTENEFYKHLNNEMRQQLQQMYKEIRSAASDADHKGPDKEATGRLLSEATDQLQEVMNTTLEATETIMGTVETMQDRLQDINMLLVSIQDSIPAAVANKLAEHANATDEAMTQIMTALSFQDLTGQRVKKVLTVLGDIQNAIFDMYVSSGLMLKTHEEMPGKNIEEISRESQRRMEEIKKSELKGPSKGTSQNDVDSLLADLGL